MYKFFVSAQFVEAQDYFYEMVAKMKGDNPLHKNVTFFYDLFVKQYVISTDYIYLSTDVVIKKCGTI